MKSSRVSEIKTFQKQAASASGALGAWGANILRDALQIISELLDEVPVVSDISTEKLYYGVINKVVSEGKLDAIKWCRDVTGSSLMDAKGKVEAIMQNANMQLVGNKWVLPRGDLLPKAKKHVVNARASKPITMKKPVEFVNGQHRAQAFIAAQRANYTPTVKKQRLRDREAPKSKKRKR